MTNTNIPKSSIRHGITDPRRKQSRTEDQEYGLPPEGISVCPDCGSFYYTKSWHHTLNADAEKLAEEHGTHSHTCPACQMQKDNVYEGEVVITLTDEHKDLKQEILNTIHNSGDQARELDPMHRILSISEKADGTIHVFTSENQLAARLGKRLKSAHKGGALEIKHSHDEDATRVYFTY